MPRITYIHRDLMLSMLACMPAQRAGETDEAFERRISKAAGRAELNYGLTPFGNGKSRARQYRESDVIAAQEINVRVVTKAAKGRAIQAAA